MRISSRESEKLEIIKWVTELKDETTLERLKALKKSKNKDWWDEITQAEKESIERGLADIKAGRVTSHKEVKKLYAKWL